MSIKSELITQLTNQGVSVDENLSILDMINLVEKIPSKTIRQITRISDVPYTTLDGTGLSYIKHLDEKIQNAQIRLCNYLLEKNVGVNEISHNTQLFTLIRKISEIQRAEPTTIAITTSADTQYIESSIKLTATLTSNGTALANMPIILHCSNSATADVNTKTNSAGQAIFNVTQTNEGAYTYTAIFNSESTYASTQTRKVLSFKKYDVTIQQSHSTNASVNQTVTITATLSNTSINEPAINFYIDGTKVSSIFPTNGVATYDIKYTTQSTHTIYCTYDGSAKFSSCKSATTTVTYSKINTTTNISYNNSNINGQTINVSSGTTATITATGTGNVTLVINGSSKTGTNSVSWSYTFSQNTYSISASSTGNDTYNGASASATISAFSKQDTSISLSLNQYPYLNESTTITAKTSVSTGGTVRILINNSQVAGQYTSNGQLSYSFTPTSTDSYTIAAYFDGNDSYNSCNSGTTQAWPQYHQITPSLSLSANQGSIYVGQSGSFNVSCNYETGMTYNGNNVSGSFSDTFNTPGSIEVRVYTNEMYSGNQHYIQVSKAVTQVVNKRTFTYSVVADSRGMYPGWHYDVRVTDSTGAYVSGMSAQMKLSTGHTLYSNSTTSGMLSFYVPDSISPGGISYTITPTSYNSTMYTGNGTSGSMTLNNYASASTGYVGPSSPGTSGGWNNIGNISSNDNNPATSVSIANGSAPTMFYGQNFNFSFRGTLIGITNVAAGVKALKTSSCNFGPPILYVTYNGGVYLNQYGSTSPATSYSESVGGSSCNITGFSSNLINLYITYEKNAGSAGQIYVDFIGINLTYNYIPAQ